MFNTIWDRCRTEGNSLSGQNGIGLEISGQGYAKSTFVAIKWTTFLPRYIDPALLTMVLQFQAAQCTTIKRWTSESYSKKVFCK